MVRIDIKVVSVSQSVLEGPMCWILVDLWCLWMFTSPKIKVYSGEVGRECVKMKQWDFQGVLNLGLSGCFTVERFLDWLFAVQMGNRYAAKTSLPLLSPTGPDKGKGASLKSRRLQGSFVIVEMWNCGCVRVFEFVDCHPPPNKDSPGEVAMLLFVSQRVL